MTLKIFQQLTISRQYITAKHKNANFSKTIILYDDAWKYFYTTNWNKFSTNCKNWANYNTNFEGKKGSKSYTFSVFMCLLKFNFWSFSPSISYYLPVEKFGISWVAQSTIQYAVSAFVDPDSCFIYLRLIEIWLNMLVSSEYMVLQKIFETLRNY